MSRFSRFVLACVLAGCGLLGIANRQTQQLYGQEPELSEVVEITRLTASNFEDYVPQGSAVKAEVGDLVLRNRYLTATIAQPVATRHVSETVRDVGGCIIDLTTRQQQADQLTAYYPGQRLFAYREWQVLDEREQPLNLQVNASVTVEQGVIVVKSPATEQQPEVTMTYRLVADEPYLTVTTHLLNTGSTSLEIPLVDDLLVEGATETVDRSPAGKGVMAWAHAREQQQAYALSLGGDGVSLESETKGAITTVKYLVAENASTIRLQPKAEFTWVRFLCPGVNLLDVRADLLELRGDEVLPAAFLVRTSAGPVPNADVVLFRAGTLWGSGRTNSAGLLQTQLPTGQYELEIQVDGQVRFEKQRYLHGDPTQPKVHEVLLKLSK